MRRSCIHAATFGLAALVAVFSGSPPPLAAQQLPSGPDDLRRRCDEVTRNFQEYEGSVLFEFCVADAPTNATANASWATLRVPRGFPSPEVAALQLPHQHAQVTEKALGWATAFSPLARVNISGLGPASASIQGATAWVTDRAATEASAALLQAAVQSLCNKQLIARPNPRLLVPADTVTGRQFLEATCLMLTGSISTTGSFMPSVAWSPLRAAVQKDLAALPTSASTHFIRLGAAAFKTWPDSAQVPRALDHGLALLAAGSAAGEFIRTRDPRTAYAKAAKTIAAEFGRIAGYGLPASAQRRLAMTRRLWFLLTALDDVLRDSAAVKSPANYALWTVKYEAMRIAYASDMDNCHVNRVATPWADDPPASWARTPAGDREACTIAFDPGPMYDRLTAALQILGNVPSSPDDAAARLPDAVRAVAAVFPLAADSVQAGGASALGAASQHFADALVALSDSDYATAVVHVAYLTMAIDTTLGGYIMPARYLRFVSLAANLAQARTTADAERAIDAIAAPPTAYLAKRTGESYVTLNAYLGLTGGYEEVRTPRGVASPAGAWAGALYLPIGVEVGRSSWGLMLQAADLGQVAAWRFSGAGSAVDASPPPFELGHIFSPGLFLIHHWPRYPVSTGVGTSYAPRFREVATAAGSTGGTPVRADAWRFSLFLALDVPILP